jgi:hypothetical protein
MLNSSGERGNPCLILDFRENGLSFSPLHMMLIICLSYIAIMILTYIPSILSFLRAFIMRWCLNLSKAFSASIEISSGFCLCFY